MEKEVKKERIALIVSYALAIVFGVTALTLLVLYFAKTKTLDIVEHLPVVIPICCIGILTTIIVVYLNQVIRKNKF